MKLRFGNTAFASSFQIVTSSYSPPTGTRWCAGWGYSDWYYKWTRMASAWQPRIHTCSKTSFTSQTTLAVKRNHVICGYRVRRMILQTSKNWRRIDLWGRSRSSPWTTSAWHPHQTRRERAIHPCCKSKTGSSYRISSTWWGTNSQVTRLRMYMSRTECRLDRLKPTATRVRCL